MTKDIIISEANDLAVVFEDGRASEFFLRHGDQLVGDIVWGQVEAVVPGIEAAFVNIGQDRNGFIHVADLPSAQAPRRQQANKKPTIKQRDRILVQIAKAPTGGKGARLTGRISIPGRFYVLVPHDNRVSISRRITEGAERERLRRVTLRLKDPGHGLIVRTEAIGRSEEDLRQDIEELIDIWADILHQVQIVNPPALLHRDSDLIHRVLRDAATTEVGKIVVDTPGGYQKAREILEGWIPELVPHVHHHRTKQSILDRYRIREELEAAISPKVWLPSGGTLVIEHTEALTVVDVNSGRLTQSRSLADTVLRTNLEAAAEVARQLRLRDIGGIIVIDFISMDTDADRKKVLAAFHEALKADKSRPQVTSFSEHGLIEVSRRRQGQSLVEQLTVPCETCHGTGRLRTSPLIPKEPREVRPPALVETAAIVHDITEEPLATEIVLPDTGELIEEEGEGDEEGGDRKRRRRRRRRRRTGDEAAAGIGGMLTSTTPEGYTPEDEDEEGFLPPVMVPAEPVRPAGRGRRERRPAAAEATPVAREEAPAPLLDDLFVEEVSLGDLDALPSSGSRFGDAPPERGGRGRGGRDRGDRGGDRGSDRGGDRGGDRGRGRGGRGDRYEAGGAERPAFAPVATVDNGEYRVVTPGPRTRRVERVGDAAPAAARPAATVAPAPVAPAAEARPARGGRKPAAAAEAPAPAAEAPAPAVVAAPVAVTPAPKPAPAAPAAKAEPAPKPAAPLPMPEELAETEVPGVFVLKKKTKPAPAPVASDEDETAGDDDKKAGRPRTAATARRATKKAVEPEAAPEAKPAAKKATKAKAAPESDEKPVKATKAKAPAKAKAEPAPAPKAKAPAKAKAAAEPDEKPAKATKAKGAAKAEPKAAETKPAAKRATTRKKAE